MELIPQKIKNVLNDFINKTNNLLGNRIKKLYYMDLMQEVIIIKIQMLIS